MTKQELSQLYYLNREIEHLKTRIAEIEGLATSTTKQITGMPHVAGVSDNIGKYVAELADLKELLQLNLKKCFYEFNRLNRYIQSIEDSELRMILSLRYISGLGWQQVARSISSYANADSVRKIHDRFLKKIQML